MAGFDGNVDDNHRDTHREEEFDAAVARALQQEADDVLFRGLLFDNRLRAAVLDRVAAEEARRKAARRRRAWSLACAGSGAAAAVLLLSFFTGYNRAGSPSSVRWANSSAADKRQAIPLPLPAAKVTVPQKPAAAGPSAEEKTVPPPGGAMEEEREAPAPESVAAAALDAGPHRYGQVMVGTGARAAGIRFIVERIDFSDRETQVHFVIPGARTPASFTIRLSREGQPPEGALSVESRQDGGLLRGTAVFNPTPREVRRLHVEMVRFQGVVDGRHLDQGGLWPVEVLLPEAPRKP